MPGMIHENYLGSASKMKHSAKDFKKIVEANDALVLADTLGRKIQKEQQYKLMPCQGLMSCVYPTVKVSVSMGRPQFASFLGKGSALTKTKRLIKEVKCAISHAATVTNKSALFPYAQVLF